MMKNTKPWREQAFGPLRDLTVEATARQVAAQRFDFGPMSTVACHLVARTFACLEDHERGQGIQRVGPFTVRIDWRGRSLAVPLLPSAMLARLATDASLPQELRDLREGFFKEVVQWDSTVTMRDVRCLLAPTELLPQRRSTSTDATQLPNEQTTEARMDLARLREILTVPDTLVPPPGGAASPTRRNRRQGRTRH